MSSVKKRGLIIFLVISAIISGLITCTLFSSVFGGLLIGGFFSIKLDFESAEKKFDKNFEDLTYLVEFFCESGYENVYIPELAKGYMSVEGKKVEIQNTKAEKAIKNLKRSGCDVIVKKPQYVLFQFWSNLDAGRGVVFSIDGSEPAIEYLTKLEKLDIDNWYYFEAK